jgi:proline racemase
MSLTPHLNLNRFEKSFTTIKTHTAGEPTRIVLSGFPKARGNTMMARKEYYAQHCDEYRQAIMAEPLGHHDMVGALLMDPASPEAELGVIYMDTNRWINMCGHATIGCATAAVETGIVRVTEPYTELVLKTPAGLINTIVKVANGKAVEVTIENVPSFLVAEGILVNLEHRDLSVDISYGGSFFALVDAMRTGYDLNSRSVPNLIQLGTKVLKRVNEQVQVAHPIFGTQRIVNCEFYGPPKSAGADQCTLCVQKKGWSTVRRAAQAPVPNWPHFMQRAKSASDKRTSTKASPAPDSGMKSRPRLR